MPVELPQTGLQVLDNISSGLRQHKLCLKAWLSCWLVLLQKWYDQSGTDRFRPAEMYTNSVLVLTWNFQLDTYVFSLWQTNNYLMTKSITAKRPTRASHF